MSKTSAGILGVFSVICSAILVFGASRIALDFQSMQRSVVVKGLSQKEVAADVMILPILFSRASNDVGELYRQLEEDKKAILAFLQKKGISLEDVSINAPTINDKIGSLYGGEQRVVYRYAGSGNLLVYTRDIERGRKALEDLGELNESGILIKIEEYNTEYLYTKLNDIKPQMIEEATLNAREAAMKFASDSQSKLGKIKRASQGQFSIAPRDKSTPHIKTIRVVSTIEYYLKD